MNLKDAKILVLTVDCWSSAIGANTMCSLFSWCKPENLANIYIRSDYPTSTICGNYFQIRENDVIKSIFKKDIVVGNRVFPGNGENDEETEKEKSRYRKFGSRRRWILLYLREIFWKIGKWKSAELKKFLDDFKPDIIFFPYEGYIHFNRLVRFAVDYTHAQAAGYFWDDNFTYKQRPYNIGYRIYRYFQRRDLKKSAKIAVKNYAITPKTQKEADEFFGITCDLLTKPIFDNGTDFYDYAAGNPVRMLYTGNLGIGRMNTIRILSEAMRQVNKDGVQIVLDIYTGTVLKDSETETLDTSVRFHAPVSQETVLSLQKKADILLFAEDITGSSREMARLSFSTKLTDYFAAGKCILALAVPDIAPMEYLAANDAALTAADREQTIQRLEQILENRNIIGEYAKKAWDCGHNNHNAEKIIGCLQSGLQQMLAWDDERELSLNSEGV